MGMIWWLNCPQGSTSLFWLKITDFGWDSFVNNVIEMTFQNGFQAFLYFFLKSEDQFGLGMNKKDKSIYLTAQKFKSNKPILHVGLKKGKN